MSEQPPGPPPGNYPPPPPPSSGGIPPESASGYPTAGPVAGTNGLATASLVCSVVGVFCGGILSIIGIVLGFVALNQIKQTGQEGKGLAQAGIIVGVISLVLGLIVAFVYLGSM